MPDHDRLSNLILVHWQRYHPSMLTYLQQESLLQSALEETAEQFTDLLYDLVLVRKLEYHRAWEIAINEFLLPEESSSMSPSGLPKTSESSMPTRSEWVARMKKRRPTSPPSGS